MSPVDRVRTRAGEEMWEGPIFLPGSAEPNAARLFFGRLKGDTLTYTVLAEDEISMEHEDVSGISRLLADSSFTPREWMIRLDATHGRSKTYRRAKAFPSVAPSGT